MILLLPSVHEAFEANICEENHCTKRFKQSAREESPLSLLVSCPRADRFPFGIQVFTVLPEFLMPIF